MSTKLIIALLILCVVPSAMASDLRSTTSQQQIEIQGHRGARSVMPENTLAGFKYALNLGVDTLELDLGVTRDNVVVVVHDQKINRTLCQYKDGAAINNDRWIRELTLAQIKEFDCGSKPNRKFPRQSLRPGSEIPTLKEVFELVRQSNSDNAQTIQFNIETKSKAEHPHAQPNPEQFARLVIDLIEEYGLTDRTTLQSFDHRTLRAANMLAPTLQLAALFDDEPNDWVEATQNAEADIVSPFFKEFDRQDVIVIHNTGLQIIPWTVNGAKDWQRMIDLGVDGIITDDPAALMDYLRRE